mgnify:CR=1 FL=1
MNTHASLIFKLIALAVIAFSMAPKIAVDSHTRPMMPAHPRMRCFCSNPPSCLMRSPEKYGWMLRIDAITSSWICGWLPKILPATMTVRMISGSTERMA